MKLTITGVKETVEHLQTVDKNLSRMETPMRQATAIVTASAKRFAPVDTGLLRGSIVPAVTAGATEVKGIVGSNVKYAPFMELGTRPHWPPVSALQTWARRHGMVAFLVARSIARRGLKARRYLQRAFDENQSRIVQLFKSEVDRITD